MDISLKQLPPALDDLDALKLTQQAIWLMAQERGPNDMALISYGMLVRLIEIDFVKPNVKPLDPQAITWAG